MEQFFSSLPKWVIAFGAIVIGFVVIVLSDPPHTVCDSQLELFKKEQAEFLYGNPDGEPKKPLGKEFYQTCESANSPGGCFEYFLRLKKLNQDLDSVSHRCSETMASDSTLKTWLFGAIKLMVQISWGDRGPASIARRNAWFDTSDLALFCGLKKNATELYGVEAVDEFRENLFASLPEASKMDREQLFQKSLFATSCEAYR